MPRKTTQDRYRRMKVMAIDPPAGKATPAPSAVVEAPKNTVPYQNAAASGSTRRPPSRPMPPFYRMPAFYLVAAAVAAAVGLASLFRGGSDASPVDTATAAVDAPSPVAPEPEPTPEPTPADDGILRTADGLRRKVLVRRLGLTPRLKPDMTSAPTGPDLDYFGLYFLYEEADPGARAGRLTSGSGPTAGRSAGSRRMRSWSGTPV